MKRQLALLIACAAASLTACGGGDGATPDPAPVVATEVPSSATVSSKAYQQFAAGLSNSETASALNVNTVTQAPTSETDTPATL